MGNNYHINTTDQRLFDKYINIHQLFQRSEISLFDVDDIRETHSLNSKDYKQIKFASR